MIVPLAGCAPPPEDMTCSQYLSEALSDRRGTIPTLFDARGRRDADDMTVTGSPAAVDEFCQTTSDMSVGTDRGPDRRVLTEDGLDPYR